MGFSVHTGWAASVSVAGPRRSPAVVGRSRIRLVELDDTVRADVYHRAALLSGAAAARLVRDSRNAAVRQARVAFDALRKSQPLVAAGIPVSAGKLPSDLAAILGSHPLIHTAEGVFYREALAAAAADCGIEVVRIPLRELPERFAAALKTNDAGARGWLQEAGRALGPPWARDQKDAAMAAVVAFDACR